MTLVLGFLFFIFKDYLVSEQKKSCLKKVIIMAKRGGKSGKGRRGGGKNLRGKGLKSLRGKGIKSIFKKAAKSSIGKQLINVGRQEASRLLAQKTGIKLNL